MQRSAIIIGAGPAGLTTALCLQRIAGVTCRVYELRKEPTTIGGAVGILSNGLRLLDRLGVYKPLLARGNSRSDMYMHSNKGNILGSADFVGQVKDQTGYGYMRIRRTDLMDVLLDAMGKEEIHVQYNKRVTDITESSEGAHVVFSDGTTDTADFLLGCDGIHSQVRRQYVDSSHAPEYSGLSGLFSIIKTEDLSGTKASEIRGMHATMTQEGMFMAMTCTASDDELCWGFQREVPEPSGGSRDGWELYRKEEVSGFKANLLDVLKDVQGEWGDTMRQLVEKTEVMQFYPMYRLPLGGDWHKGRCLLMGDAAHAMSPHAGQGVSMAFEDAFLLAKILRNAQISAPEAYEKFESIRRPRVDEIASLAAQNAAMRKKSGPFGIWMKELGIWMYMTASWMFPSVKWGSPSKYMIYDIDSENV